MTLFGPPKLDLLASLRSFASRSAKAIIRMLPHSIGKRFGERLYIPRRGHFHFGDFGRLNPISMYGFDRGKPIDRYYIELALREHSQLVRGRVLEIAGRDYTQLFGGERVLQTDVLDIDATNPLATIVGDLSLPGVLPDDAFDCIIVTQTLQLIYDLESTVKSLFPSLAPGGALMITVPGISAIESYRLEQWCWAFTENSLRRLLSLRFEPHNVEIVSYGNVYSAICFLTGLSLEEIDPSKLDYKDQRYPVTIFACARKRD
jgi:hypothetical protein